MEASDPTHASENERSQTRSQIMLTLANCAIWMEYMDENILIFYYIILKYFNILIF